MGSMKWHPISGGIPSFWQFPVCFLHEISVLNGEITQIFRDETFHCPGGGDGIAHTPGRSTGGPWFQVFFEENMELNLCPIFSEMSCSQGNVFWTNFPYSFNLKPSFCQLFGPLSSIHLSSTFKPLETLYSRDLQQPHRRRWAVHTSRVTSRWAAQSQLSAWQSRDA